MTQDPVQPFRPGVRRRIAFGRWLDRTGQLALPLGVGLALGFWISDLGVRWMPSMLGGLSVFFVGALLVILLGQWLKGRVVRQTEGKSTVRRRTVVLLFLALAAAGVRLGVYWLEQPSGLTRLDELALEQSFTLDTQQLTDLEQGLERTVARLEAAPLFRPGRPRQTLTASDEELLRDAWWALCDNAFALEQIRIFYEDWYRFDPSRAERPLLLRSYLLTFAAELALYEKSLRFTRLVERNREVEKFLDAPHPAFDLPEHSFSRLRQEMLGARDQARVLAGASYLRWLDRTLAARRLARQLGLEGLWQAIEERLRTINGIAPLVRASETVEADFELVRRRVRRTWFPAQKGIADWMGDVRTRRIGRYLITPEQLEEASRHLEPGDVLLSRKNWYLSNLGLPGFWPHAILYLGPPARLEQAFDTPEVRSYLTRLAGEETSVAGYFASRYPAAWARYDAGLDGEPIEVLEAISEGVVLNTLHHAAGDYLAALRPRLEPLAKLQAILTAFDQLGKPYDFDFDFATDHALVCTEVVWRSYRPASGKPGLTFPMVEVAGRLTLPANQIAQLYGEEHDRPDRQLDFVYFLDGREREKTAVVASEEDFRRSWQRYKWDVLQK